MTLYEYISPILKFHPNKKCILYNKEAVYTGKIGDIPSKYMITDMLKVMLGDKYMHFWDKINDTEDILRIWITDIEDINSKLGILGGV